MRTREKESVLEGCPKVETTNENEDREKEVYTCVEEKNKGKKKL